MTEKLGFLRKMRTQLADPVQYEFILDQESFNLNQFLNKDITVEFLNEINCVQCGRKTPKSFQQGFCFPCMQRINECNNCQLFPEKCLVETGKCPENDWAHAQCHQKQIVYLANSTGLKVGITRITQMPTRWIDQGAAQALPIFETQNRYQCGLIEVALKQFVSDRTNWRDMLKNNIAHIDLIALKNKLLMDSKKSLENILNKYHNQIILLDNQNITKINYPVLEYPTIIKSLSFDKTPKITGKLLGIKGQYLMLDTGVLNIRKFGGYLIEFVA